MPITESLGALGQWTLQLRDSTPRRVRDQIQYFGHITVHTGRVEPALVGDGLLASSRYTGVLRGKGEADEGFDLSGCGMEFWLGDEDDKGVVIEAPLTFTAETYTQTVRDMLALTTAVTEGTFHAVAGTYSGTHQYQVLRKAIAYVASTGGLEYRVNGDATMDLGEIDDLFVTTPKCLVVRRGAGVDMDLRALLGKSDVDSDVEDFTTRVVLLAASTESTVATGDADINPALNPFKDLHGNPVQLTRMVSESTTDATNADARAQLQLNRFTGTRDALALSTEEYDINGSARIGDYLWVFNPDIGLVDLLNEVTFRGVLMNPIKLRMIETTWPVSPGFMVAYRDPNGAWLDLTDYVVWEGGQTSVKVGGYNRSLVGGSQEPIGRLPQPDASVPAQVAWVEPFNVGVYQSPTTGVARGDVRLTWLEPDNTDLTPIVDGSHYEIRYRRATIPAYPVTWDMKKNLGQTWGQSKATGATWGAPIQFPETDWQHAIAPFDVQAFRLQELEPAMPYEAQIRAVDLAVPPNVGAWSDLAIWQTTQDNIAPATPAHPLIAASTLAVQMTHMLGTSAGGNFNLDRDLHHLRLYGGTEPYFTPSEDNLLGKVLANWGMIVGEIPAVATFPLDNLAPTYFKVVAVDEAGNASLPSASVMQTAQLVDNAHISDLTVSKLTAGIMTADVLVGGRIATMNSGVSPGVEITNAGIKGKLSSGVTGLEWQSSTGKLIVNAAEAIEINDGRLVVKNAAGNKIVELGECADGRHGIQVYKDNGTRVARIGELATGSEGIEVINDAGALVRVSTLAFGTSAATIATLQNRIGTGFGDMITQGPTAAVEVGNTLRMIVIIGAWCSAANVGGGSAYAGFDIAGPSGFFTAASFSRSVGVLESGGVGSVSASKAFLIESLPTIGTYYASMKYTSLSGSDLAQFQDRHLIMIPF